MLNTCILEQQEKEGKGVKKYGGKYRKKINKKFPPYIDFCLIIWYNLGVERQGKHKPPTVRKG